MWSSPRFDISGSSTVCSYGRMSNRESNYREQEQDHQHVKQGQENQELQQIWSWGAGTDGQLGTGRLQDEQLPQLLNLPCLSSAGTVASLACGGAHVIALTTCGKLLTWGRGSSGQLGCAEVVNYSLYPRPVTSLKSYIITHISAGWSHSGFVSDNGHLFTCGDGSFGQLGHGDYRSHSCPVRVSFFIDQRVSQIACGMRHSLALVADSSGNRIHGFGFGKRGQLGVCKDRIKSINLPKATIGLEDVEIVQIAANGDHSAARTVDGHLYTWGRAFGGVPDTYVPQCLDSSSCIIKAAVGWNNALALTGEGDVLMLGGNNHRVLADPAKLDMSKRKVDDATNSTRAILEKVGGFHEMRVVDIAAGAEHSLLVTENGEVKTWGWGEHGQLGLGDTCDRTSPSTVSFDHEISKSTRIRVYCGSGFTFVTMLPQIDSFMNTIDALDDLSLPPLLESQWKKTERENENIHHKISHVIESSNP